MAGRVTIKSIARDLGISHMTVSRALSNHPHVQKETREAILRRADELGYVKSAAATAIRGDRTKIVGLLLPNLVNEFYARFANTLAAACEARSYHLIIHLTNDDAGVEKQSLQRLQEVQAMAVVMVPTPGTPAGIAAPLAPMKVIQLIRQRPMGVPSAAVLVDDRTAIEDAVRCLAGLGHRQIAFIGADAALSSGRARLAAFRAGLVSAELPQIQSLVRTGSPSREMGQDFAGRLIDQGKAAAIVCGGFEISNGALSAFMERGISPNGQVRLVGYGDPSFYAWIDGGITTIRVPVDDLAYRAADFIGAEWHAGAPPEDGAKAFEASLIVRNR